MLLGEKGVMGTRLDPQPHADEDSYFEGRGVASPGKVHTIGVLALRALARVTHRCAKSGGKRIYAERLSHARHWGSRLVFKYARSTPGSTPPEPVAIPHGFC